MNDKRPRPLGEGIAAYMLGALEPGEAAELERHRRLRGLPRRDCAG